MGRGLDGDQPSKPGLNVGNNEAENRQSYL